MNPPAYESLTTGQELKPGSLIVLENRSLDGSLSGLSVRLKIKGYHPEGNDWYWLQYDEKGKATCAGEGYECLRCHDRGKNINRPGAASK